MRPKKTYHPFVKFSKILWVAKYFLFTVIILGNGFGYKEIKKAGRKALNPGKHFRYYFDGFTEFSGKSLETSRLTENSSKVSLELRRNAMG